MGKLQTVSWQICWKMNPITRLCQKICLHLRSTCFKIHLKEKAIILKIIVYYVTQGILLFIFSGCSLYVWLIDGQPFTNTKKNLLINSNKKERDIWKLKSENAHWKVQCMVQENNMKNAISVCWCQNKLNFRDSTTYIRYSTFTTLHLMFAVINPHGLYLTFVGEGLRVKFCFGSFCFVKQTELLSILLPSVQIYVIKFFQNLNTFTY